MDSGEKFGLQPIGTSGIDESAPKNDSTRSAFPALATKGSVFNWTNPAQSIINESGAIVGRTYTVNLRGGNSGTVTFAGTDVPTWAAGCLITLTTQVSTLGVGVTRHSWTLRSSIYASGTNLGFIALPLINLNLTTQFIIPFYDEPIFTLTEANDLGNTNGSVDTAVSLLGFVRNV